MSQVLSWSLVLTLWLQANAPWLLEPMRAVSALGTEYFFLLILPYLYWCVDPRRGVRMGLLLCASASLNASLKLFFHQPRPYWVSDHVIAGEAETSYGLPSGHAQNAVVFWGLLAQGGSGWVRFICAALIFLIGFSRILLGVHFASDVLVGWALGGLLLWLNFRWERSLTAWYRRHGITGQVGIAFLGSLVLIALPLLASVILPPQDPASWVSLAFQAFPGSAFHPRDLGGVIGLAGVFFGFLAGWSFLRRREGLPLAIPWRRKLFRFLVGIIVTGGSYGAISLLFASQGGILVLSLRYLASAIVGFWIAFLAPLLFFRLHL